LPNDDPTAGGTGSGGRSAAQVRILAARNLADVDIESELAGDVAVRGVIGAGRQWINAEELGQGTFAEVRAIGRQLAGRERGAGGIVGTLGYQAAHGAGWHQSVNGCAGRGAVGIDVALDVILATHEEGPLLVAVEAGARDLDRTSDVRAGVDLAIRRLGIAVVLGEPVLVVQRCSAAVDVEGAVIVRPAGFTDGVDDDGTLCRVGTEVGSLDLDLLNVVHVDDLVGASAAAGIGDVDAVGGD